MSDTEPKLVYSGRVPKHDLRDPKWREDSSDLLGLELYLCDETEEFLFIHIDQPSFRANLRLNKYQTRALYRCMENASRWRDQ